MATQITTMEAVCDQPTPVSLAQHTYWNLGGHGSGSVLDHTVRIASREYTPVGDGLIPTGELLQVKGTNSVITLGHQLHLVYDTNSKW